MFLADSYPLSLRNLRIAIIAFVFCLGFSFPSYAQSNRSTTDKDTIRPFKVKVPEKELVDLRRRIAATRWPNKETDSSQGVPFDRLQELSRYWGSGYDWRKVEAKLNTLPQFVTKIDGLDIHFIHVRSKHRNALPVIITHGWPGSVIEQLKIIGPLTDPTAHGGRAEDAFDVVIPSLPGFGFSGRPTDIGWGPDRIEDVNSRLISLKKENRSSLCRIERPILRAAVENFRNCQNRKIPGISYDGRYQQYKLQPPS